MIPLTFIAVAWIFNPSVVHWGQLSGFHQLDGTGFFSGLGGHGWLTVYIAYAFLLTWNVIAMEAAACYIGECKDPERDAKIAMNLEGAYGLFIYTLIPIAFIVVLGAKALSNSALVDPKTIFVTFSRQGVRRTGGNVAQLVDRADAHRRARALGVERDHGLRAVACTRCRSTGSSRASSRRSTSTAFRIARCSSTCSARSSSILAGGAVEIYSFSNVGYTFSFLPVLVGYYLLRKYKPNARRPVRLPEFFKYVALAMAVFYFIIWLYGGIYYSKIGHTLVYYLAGWGVLVAYLPLYWYRVKVEDKRQVPEAPTGGAHIVEPKGTDNRRPSDRVLLREEGRAIPPAAVERAARARRARAAAACTSSPSPVSGGRAWLSEPGLAAEQARVGGAACRGRGRREGAGAARRRRDRPRARDAQGDEAHRRRGGAARLHGDRDGRRPAAQPRSSPT